MNGKETAFIKAFGEILKFLSDTGKYILINTNGSLITRNKHIIDSLGSNVKFVISFDAEAPALAIFTKPCSSVK